MFLKSVIQEHVIHIKNKVCTDLIKVTVEPIVNDRVKVFKSAPMECIEGFSACPCPLKPGIHLVIVFNLKQEVWCGCRKSFTFCQVAKLSILKEISKAILI